MTSDDPIANQVPCPECAALNPQDAKFCADCGCMFARPPQAAAIEAVPARRPTRAAGPRRRASADAVEKSRARHEFARTKNIVLTVRFVYWSSSILALLHVAMWHTVLAKLVGYAFDDWYLAVTFLVYSQFALMVAGAVLVLRGPLLWTVIGACSWTLNTAMQWWLVLQCIEINHLIETYQLVGLEKIQLGPMIVFVGFWTLMLIAFWFAVAQAARVQRLLAENPELQIVRKRIDPSLRVEGGVADRARAQRRRESGQLWQGRLKIGGMAAGLLAIVITAIVWANRPPAVDPTVEKFASLWRGGDVDAVVGLLTPRRGDLHEEIERRGWLDAMPKLGAPEVEARGSTTRVEYPCANGTLTAEFRLAGAEWQLAALTVPPIEPGDVQPALDAFRAAWSAEGIDALVELFRPEARDRQRRALETIFERRDWLRQRPDLGDVDPGRVRKGRVRVLFGIGFDDLGVTFDYWHPQWYIVALRPPS